MRLVPPPMTTVSMPAARAAALAAMNASGSAVSAKSPAGPPMPKRVYRESGTPAQTVTLGISARRWASAQLYKAAFFGSAFAGCWARSVRGFGSPPACWNSRMRSASSRCSKPTIRSSAYRKTMPIEKFAFPSASDVQCRDRRRLDPFNADLFREPMAQDCGRKQKRPACAGGASL